MNALNYRHTKTNSPFIPQRADPYILHHTDGTYYFTASVPEYDRIILRRADTLAQLQTAEEVTIWKKHEQGIMSIHIWAPELHFLDGAWYMYFAAGDVNDIWAIRPYVLFCMDDDPIMGRWQEFGLVHRADDFCFNDFSLDMTVFELQNRRFAVWAEKVNIGKKISNLYIAEMDSPASLKTPQMLLSFPSYNWEQIGFWVNEGPSFMMGSDHAYLTYSASETGPHYCMGLLVADINSDLLDPNSWKKSKIPVLMSDAEMGLYGPGHNSFFTDSNGDIMMAYHARPYDEIIGDPLYDPNRHCYLMKIVWKDDVPVLSFSNNYVR
jgi:GH43 family beta-xylosidase